MDQITASTGFAAMGSDARLAVLRLLVRAGNAGLTVSDLQTRSGIAPSTLAHHLRVLTEAGVTEQVKDGRKTITRANYETLRQLATYVLEECCADLPDKDHDHD